MSKKTRIGNFCATILQARNSRKGPRQILETGQISSITTKLVLGHFSHTKDIWVVKQVLLVQLINLHCNTGARQKDGMLELRNYGKKWSSCVLTQHKKTEVEP